MSTYQYSRRRGLLDGGEMSPGMTAPRINPQPSPSSAWDGSFWDQGKYQSALAAEGRSGGEASANLSNAGWMQALNPLSGLTQFQAATPERDTVYGGDSELHGHEDAAGAVYKDKLGRMYRDTGKDASGNALVQYFDNNGEGWAPPGSDGKVRLKPTYSLDASGNATPVSSGSAYLPSDWVRTGQPVAALAAAMAGAYFGGTALAGAGGSGGASGAAAGAGGSGAGTGGAMGAQAIENAAAQSAAGGAASGGGATNAALIDSFLQTPGYGASSAGLGGGAGELTAAAALPSANTAPSWLDSLKAGNYGDLIKEGGSSALNWVIKNPQSALQLGTLAAGAMGAGGKGGGSGGGSGGGGPSYTPQSLDTTGWQSSVQPMQTQPMQAQMQAQQPPQGLLDAPPGQVNDGLWRFKQRGLLG